MENNSSETRKICITYDVSFRDQIRTHELAFVTGVIADLRGSQNEDYAALKDRKFVEITRAYFDCILAAYRPRVDLRVPSILATGAAGPMMTVTLTFRSLADFSPSAIAARIAPLNDLLQSRNALEHRRESILSPEIESEINSRLAAIDQAISRQLDAVMHHPDLQRLEATWRNLWSLVNPAESSEDVKLCVLHVKKDELMGNLEGAAELEQSALYRKIYREIYGIYGGQPLAVLIADYDFDRDSRDVALLERLARVVAEAHVLLLAGASPRMFGVASFPELALQNQPVESGDVERYSAWRRFRQSDAARFVGLVLPRMLLRLPYRADRQFRYEEQTTDHEHYLWGNAAFALAARIMDSFRRFGWYSAIQGVEGGGLVSGLPLHIYLNEEGDPVVNCPTEIPIAEPLEVEFTHAGFISLVQASNTDFAAFFSVPSCHEPTAATAYGSLGCMLAVSRFTYYLRRMMADRASSDADKDLQPHISMSKEACEAFLNRWLRIYTAPDDPAGFGDENGFPLKHAIVKVEELADSPGSYSAILEIQPLFQFSNVIEPVRTAFSLPPSTI